MDFKNIHAIPHMDHRDRNYPIIQWEWSSTRKLILMTLQVQGWCCT
ncbi:unnamed protein product [Brassica oleracea]